MLEARNRAIAAYNRGLEKAHTGDLAAATQALEEALGEDPMHIEARNVLGKVYMHRGEHWRAERCWQQVLLIDPDNATARECLNALRGRDVGFKMSSRHFFVLGGLFAFLVAFGIIYVNLQEIYRSIYATYALLQLQNQEKGLTQTSLTPPKPPSTTAEQQEKPATPTAPNSERPGPPLQKPTEMGKAPPAMASEKRAPSSRATVREERDSLPVRENKVRDKGTGSAAAYRQAVSQVFAGHHDQAILMFLDLAEDEGLPNDLKDNVHFWLGSCYAAKRQYENGLAHYLKVIREFPEGNKRPEAMIGAANCYARLGQYNEAVSLLRKVLDEKPTGIRLKPVEEKLKHYMELNP